MFSKTKMTDSPIENDLAAFSRDFKAGFITNMNKMEQEIIALKQERLSNAFDIFASLDEENLKSL